MGKFIPVFTDLEMAVTKILNDRTATGVRATILSDRVRTVAEEVYARTVLIADSMGLHTVHQFCYQTPIGIIENFGFSQNCVSEPEVRKYMHYLDGDRP
ncbi:hypothetical protein [Brevibacillus brevis]|uniref:hypothetical protein n=1 Tax=Brevibacillus brevis TaxID=1393 RepID=UPI000D0F4D97|nr:hypothetical protein [Brevibacillus brevis]PSJ67194.1 hypothetical protein C7J99_22845 [Brevibacillus brevis]RED25763.1 hypothetical protein DES34_112203 [Brevibacillus brevis]GEC93639.1 hypothetical protein BBR01nite_59700 [Brevibacillus brevis]VEF87229.1 Uncharacterised protein [Brevibacillus brevis]